MEDTTSSGDLRFCPLAMTLNALERSRANERKIESYKCPCFHCKGGGRPILRLTIETHLRQHGRDSSLMHPMLPEDSDVEDFRIPNHEAPSTDGDGQSSSPVHDTFDDGFDFHRLTTEWFQAVDNRRENMAENSDVAEDGNYEGVTEDEADYLDTNMEEWLHHSQVPLYRGSKLSTLACVLVLMNLAHLHNVSNSFMDELLSFLRLDILPVSNGLPKNRYEARRFIDRLGLSFNTIHVCRNGCTLFWKDRQHLSECPKCHSSRYVTGSNSVPIKVLRHFPLIPRLLRMYRCRDIASLMRWHETNGSIDGKLRSVLDCPAWKHVKNIDASFFNCSRNVKLGLALDGMNPFADKSTKHSTWPVFLLNYNLPGWMVTKRFFVMLSLVIPGKESVKSANIDVYLEPLVDDLLLLWNGVPAVDMSDSPRAKKFTLRGMLLWTIHDYPGYGLISGCATKGYQGCPICGPNVDSRYSKSLKKNIFQGHRRYLPADHPFRFMTDAFNGKEEHRTKPNRVSGLEHRKRGEARERWLAVGGTPGSENDPAKRHGVKRNSVLFKLPYWEKLLIRHILDVMHCEKNIAENLICTLMGIKDGPAVRKDMQEAGCKKALHIRTQRPPATGFHIPRAPYIFTKENKKTFIDRLKSLKTPTGFMSNLKTKISPEGTLHGLKSHDYHVLIQQVLPVCIRGLLPARVEKTILHLSSIFRKMCSKVIDPELTQSMTEEVAVVLCLLEREFPPSFFDSMTHLLVHLVEELQLCGPVHNRWMYPLERYMKYMKSYVRNKARPEGCMATGIAMETGLGLSTEYILECESTGQRVWDKDEELAENGEVTCSAYRIRNLSNEERLSAHSCVLNNSTCLDDLRQIHHRLTSDVENRRAAYRRGVHPRQRRRMEFPMELNEIPVFSEWLKLLVQSGNLTIEDDVLDLSTLPSSKAKSFKSMRAYGNYFRVFSVEGKLVTTDSGVSATCETIQRSGPSDRNTIVGQVTYFGRISEIIELDYGRLKPVVLLCDWVEPIWRGATACMKTDKYGYTFLKLRRLMRRSANSFIFPVQACKIFFCTFKEEPEWSTVLYASPRGTRVYQDSESEGTASVSDMEAGILAEDIQEGELLVCPHDLGFDDGPGENITEEELLAADIAVECEAQEFEEQGSDDDTLLEFGVDEDELEDE